MIIRTTQNKIYDIDELVKKYSKCVKDVRFVEETGRYVIYSQDKALLIIIKTQVSKIGEKIVDVAKTGDLVRYGKHSILLEVDEDNTVLRLLGNEITYLYVKNYENGYNLVYKNGKVL